MITADFIFIGVAILFCVIGLMKGFGKSLEFMTGGFRGVLISIFVCYLIFGFVLNLSFVQSLLDKFKGALSGSDNGLVKFLLTIRIDVIALALVLFVLAQIVRKIIFKIVSAIIGSNNVVMKVINKVLGVALMLAVFMGLLLVVGQILYAANQTDVIYPNLKGSFFHLDKIFMDNPLKSIIHL